MPRPWTLTVEAFTALVGTVLYAMRVVDVSKGDGETILVTLVHLSRAQAGRIHRVELPLPVHPGNLVAQLFAAAIGARTDVGTVISPREAIGKIVAVRFEVPAGAEPIVVEFKPLNKEPSHGA